MLRRKGKGGWKSLPSSSPYAGMRKLQGSEGERKQGREIKGEKNFSPSHAHACASKRKWKRKWKRKGKGTKGREEKEEEKEGGRKAYVQ